MRFYHALAIVVTLIASHGVAAPAAASISAGNIGTERQAREFIEPRPAPSPRHNIVKRTENLKFITKKETGKLTEIGKDTGVFVRQDYKINPGFTFWTFNVWNASPGPITAYLRVGNEDIKASPIKVEDSVTWRIREGGRGLDAGSEVIFSWKADV
ncbi:hypothetical protein CTRI78_v011186 [Colletotrichum trifolii]|uniref:Uncharacterized protein n=1 Tax=Colletotrichum trifolii TaxID=5466 RepID=A0A4R8QRV0_COLTR|nr:hypothetical protein CTRI78_v011186 [Colletotrichum trifolii]